MEFANASGVSVRTHKSTRTISQPEIQKYNFTIYQKFPYICKNLYIATVKVDNQASYAKNEKKFYKNMRYVI